MDGFLVALALTVFCAMVAGLWLARVIHIVVGRAVDALFHAFDRGDPG